VPAGGAVLGADTEVLLDGHALGKPDDAEDARRMLASLSGRTHEVVSAMALVTEAGTRVSAPRAPVRFRDLSGPMLDWYVTRGEWRERAGAYAIQGAGAALVEGIDGEPSTVIGLPLGALAGLLAEAGLAPWSGGPAQKSGG